MAKDDYFVIVCQILAYLYRCLKDGEDIDPKLLEPDSKYLNINDMREYKKQPPPFTEQRQLLSELSLNNIL